MNLKDTIQVYSDGSGYKGQIGVAAVLFREGKTPRTLQYHLGTENEHTVFEAEQVGLTLAARLIATEQDLTFPLSISVDNQASIRSGESFQSCPGSYLADCFRRMMQRVAKDHNNFDITVRWVPGHSDVHGNEEADKHAKLAAENRQNNSSRQKLPHYLRHGALPLSISALKEVHHKDMHAAVHVIPSSTHWVIRPHPFPSSCPTLMPLHTWFNSSTPLVE